jgi:hypothetical protein
VSELAPKILIGGSAGLVAFALPSLLLSALSRREGLSGPETDIAILTLLLALIVVQARAAVHERGWKWVALATALFLLSASLTVLF